MRYSKWCYMQHTFILGAFPYQKWNDCSQYCGSYKADTNPSTDRQMDTIYRRTEARWNQYTPTPTTLCVGIMIELANFLKTGTQTLWITYWYHLFKSNMISHQYKNPYHKDKTVSQLSYHNNGNILSWKVHLNIGTWPSSEMLCLCTCLSLNPRIPMIYGAREFVCSPLNY